VRFHYSDVMYLGKAKLSLEYETTFLSYSLMAQDLCRKGIMKRMNESEEPNWNELILGKTP